MEIEHYYCVQHRKKENRKLNYFAKLKYCIILNKMPPPPLSRQKGFNRSSAATKIARAYRSRKSSNKPVSRAITYYKKKPAAGAYSTNNRNAIMTLATQVKKLQLSQLGAFQKRAEKVAWLKTESATLPFTKSQPMAICLNQFVDKKLGTVAQYAPIYGTNSNGNGYVMKRFEKWDLAAFAGNPAVNPHWSAQDDVVSTELYKPLGTKLTFELIYNNVAATQPANWVRIDIIRPKKTLLRAGLIHELNMPNGLGQFTHLADTNVMYRNYINKQYWDIKYTKWVKCENTTGTDKMIQKVFTVTRSYKNQAPIRCDLDAYEAGSNAPNFYENVPSHDLEWMILTPASNASVPDQLNILRNISWRDQHGTAA